MNLACLHPFSLLNLLPSIHLLFLILHPSEHHLELKTPSCLQDYTCHSSHNTDFVSHTNISNSHSLFALSIVTHTEPKSYAKAIKHDSWKQAMQNELNVLDQTGT